MGQSVTGLTLKDFKYIVQGRKSLALTSEQHSQQEEMDQCVTKEREQQATPSREYIRKDNEES